MTKVALLADNLGFTEGPVILPDGTLWVTSITHGSLYHLSADGRVIEQVQVGGGPNGLTISADGRLYVAQNGGIWGGLPGTQAGIQVVDQGRVEFIVTDVGAPNDLCFGPGGRLYFTDPISQCDPNDDTTVPPGRLYACNADGTGLELLHRGLKFINGIAYTPGDDGFLVTETAGPHAVHKVNPAATGEWRVDLFFPLPAGAPDGLAIAEDGTIWVAATGDDSVHVFAPDAQFLRKIECGPGSLPTNVCFGDDRKTLYITASGRGAVLVHKACSGED